MHLPLSSLLKDRRPIIGAPLTHRPQTPFTYMFGIEYGEFFLADGAFLIFASHHFLHIVILIYMDEEESKGINLSPTSEITLSDTVHAGHVVPTTGEIGYTMRV